MIEIKEKGITSLELSKHLIKRLNFDVWKTIDRQKLSTYDWKHLNTHEKELRVVWSPSQPPSPSKAMCEFSSGDSSPCDDDQYQAKIEFIGTKLSIREICNTVLNSNCYEISILEPTKTGKQKKIPQEWQNQRDIILFNFDSTLDACQDKHSIKKYLKEKFQDYVFITIEEVQKIYLAGEQAYIIKINEDKSAQFFYYNMSMNQPKHKKYIGENFQVGILRKVRDIQVSYRIILRFLPIYFVREKIESIIYERKNDKFQIDYKQFRVDELFEFEGCKYGIIYCDDLRLSQQLVDLLNRYFFERKISQPEIIAINEEGKCISSVSHRQEYQNFFQMSFDTQKTMKQTLQQEIEKEIQKKQEKQEKQDKLERQEKYEKDKQEKYEKEKQHSEKKKYHQDIIINTVEINSNKQYERQEKQNEKTYHNNNYHYYNNKYESRNNTRRSRSQSRRRRHSSSESSKKYYDRKHRSNRNETNRKSGWESRTRK